MMWNLPLAVEIDGIEYNIRNQCDYRVVLDVISALNDEELEMNDRLQCCLFIFYEDLKGLTNYEKAVNEMMKIINLGEEEQEASSSNYPIMDWEYDFNQICPPVSRILGYSVRDSKNYTHWYDFIGAYSEIGECTFANIISIRSKRRKGKKLAQYEEEFYRENRKLVDLPHKLSADEEEFLYSDW